MGGPGKEGVAKKTGGREGRGGGVGGWVGLYIDKKACLTTGRLAG